MNNLIASLEKNYTFEKEIGRGGMGVVYLATDKRLDRQVAVKVLTLSANNADKVSVDEIIQRFQREGKAIARLSHTNIVNIYDIGDEDDKYYMVMEFLEGKDLSSILEEKKRIPPLLAVNIGAQICSALDYAHENGIIHRDIKPANIILSRKGIAKLTDFGIAQLNKEQAKLTQAGSVLGSIMYIPPEQLHNSANVDNRADIYSLGITLYELITGVLPFGAETISELFMKILSEEPKPVSSYSPDIPEVLDLIIAKALIKDVSGRYQSAREMGRDLSRLVDSDFLSGPALNLNSYFSVDSTTSTKERRNAGDTIVINSSKTSAEGFLTTSLRKTSIDKNIISSLKSNYAWVNNLLENWRTEHINRLTMQQIIDKVMEPSLYGKAFTGALIIDKNIYVFIYDGLFLGAVNTVNNATGETVFQSFPENPASIELKIPDDEMLFAPVIIASIISANGEILHNNLDSSLVNLVPLIENLSSEDDPFSGYLVCYTELNIYYSGYYKGKLLFSVPANAVSTINNPGEVSETESVTDIRQLALTQGIIFNAYIAKPVLSGPTIFKMLKNSTVKVKYNDAQKANLYNIVAIGNEEVPIHIIKEVKQNVTLDLDLNQPAGLNILDQEIDLPQVVRKSVYYHFAEWMINEYFYLLNSSGNITSLKYIYTWIPAIENFKFFESLPGEDGNAYQFSIIFHGEVKGENYKKVLMLIRFGDGTKEDVSKFIDETIQVKKKLIKSGDIGGAIYVSTEEYGSDSLKLFYERTVEPRKGFGLGSLDKLTKYKGFVRIGFGRGFHLNLLEYKKEDNSFQVIAPLLK